MKILSRVKTLIVGQKPVPIDFAAIAADKKTARRNYLRRLVVEPENYEGRDCKECGEIIEVYSRSGYCRHCYHRRQLISRPTAADRKCWNCSNTTMKIFKTNKSKCFLKCAECGATDNLGNRHQQPAIG